MECSSTAHTPFFMIETHSVSLSCAKLSLNLRVNNDIETDINRLKAVLAEKKRTNKWLCEQLNVNPSTVSKWCTNSSQPDLPTLVKIAKLLEVNVDDLLNTKIVEI